MTLQAVFFDVGNTLVFPYPSVSEVCREVLSAAGHTRDLSAIDELMPLVDAYYEDQYRADDTFWTSEEETSSVWVGMYSLLCRKLGIETEAAVIARRVYDEFGKAERWRAYDDVAPALDRLRARGIATGVISNWDGRLQGLLAKMGLAARFDTIVSSSDVGMRKPDPRIFELACWRVGVAPEDAAHVGDHHYSDILGARAAGMQAVLVDRHGTEALPIGPVPIYDFEQLEAALGLD